MLIFSQAPANSWQVETVRVFADSITYKRDMLLCNFVDRHTFEELMNNHPIEPPDEQLAKLFEQLSTYILGGVRTLGVMKRVAYGLYYIVYWDWTFQLRLSLGKYVRKVIIFSAALEILGACFHWVKSLYLYELEHQTIGLHRAQQKLITWIDLSGTAPFFTWVSSGFNEIVRITTILEPYLMLVLLSCALVLWWHHHRLSMRVERHWNAYWVYGATLRLDPLVSRRLEMSANVSRQPFLEYGAPGTWTPDRSGWIADYSLRVGF